MARARAAGHRPLGYGRFLVPPCGLATSPWAPALAGVCGVALITVSVFEILTPSDVFVATLGLLPLLAALWALSGRLAGLVVLLSLVLFAVVFVEEPSNRPTLLYFGAATLVIGIALRMYATSMAKLLATLGPRRSRLPWTAMPSSLGAFGGAFLKASALSRRELEVAQLASHGYMASEIGARLHISHRTVETHIANAYAKLGVSSRQELIRLRWNLPESLVATEARPG